MRFRKWTDASRPHSRFYLDLRPLRHVSPAAALLLASELDRWRLIHHRRLRARDTGEWDTRVRSLLRQMGFFELLNVSDDEVEGCDEDGSTTNTKFIQFIEGVSTDGKFIRELRNRIETYVGRMPKMARLLFFQAISEALTNVRHHAYGAKAASRRLREPWWMSASIDFKASTITLMVLDHGVGIPRTLPQKPLGDVKKEEFLRSLRNYVKVKSLVGFNDDARMIDAAVFLGRSRTNQPNRGHGLSRDIQRLVRSIDGRASLRIYSNRGRYWFEKESTGAERTTLKNWKISLEGTFVEWKFEIPHTNSVLT
jgi:hypothetical protein